jgi:O-antigen/teichoic acid export membrane protein
MAAMVSVTGEGVKAMKNGAATMTAGDGGAGAPAARGTRRQLSRDIVGVFSSRTAVTLFGTVTGIILARKLGPHDRGLLTLVLLLPATLTTITKFGITQANVYCVRREGASVGAVASNSLALAVYLGFGLGVLGWLFRTTLLSTVMREVPVWALVLALARLPLLLIDNYFCGVLQAINNFSIYNRRTVIGGFLLLVAIVALWLTAKLTLMTAVSVYSLASLIVVVWLLLDTRRLIPFGMGMNRQLLGQQMRFGLKSYTQVLAMHLLFRIDVYMVSYFLNASQTAFYGLALHFTETILEIPQAVGWVIYPRLTSLDKQQVHELTAQVCRRTVLLTGLGGLAVVSLGPFVIPLWYGHAFAAASKPLAFATVGMVMMSVFTIITRDFTSRNKQVVNICAGTVALLLNVLLNVFMIPAFGISGAALATSISYSVAALMLMVAYHRESGIALSEVVIPQAADVRFIWDAAWQSVKRSKPRPVTGVNN